MRVLAKARPVGIATSEGTRKARPVGIGTSEGARKTRPVGIATSEGARKARSKRNIPIKRVFQSAPKSALLLLKESKFSIY